MRTLYVPVPPSTTRVTLIAVVAPGETRPGCDTLPAYNTPEDCARAHPGCIPWPIQLEVHDGE